MRRSLLLLALASASSLPLAAAGCGGDDTSAATSAATTGSSTTSSTTATTTTTTSTTGAGGAGGAGGGATTTTTTTTTGSGGAGGGTTAGAGGGSAGDHVLISEIAVGPDSGEFIEIWNPTAAAIDLSDYYLSDNSTYFDIAAGDPWMPITNNPGTDFLARFPAGTSIPADGVLVIAFDGGYEMEYGGCPDFYMALAPVLCGGAMVPAMAATEVGSVTDISGLSNMREMAVLFTWDGNAANILQDADYVTWGATFEPGTRVDKTAVPGYQPDTAPDLQAGAAAPPVTESSERCQLETGETLAGGNGLGGHDETSEDLASSFTVQATPTPGVKNACLP